MRRWVPSMRVRVLTLLVFVYVVMVNILIAEMPVKYFPSFVPFLMAIPFTMAALMIPVFVWDVTKDIADAIEKRLNK